MELIIAYVAKGLLFVTSVILYVYFFSSIIPKTIMKLRIKSENTRDRGVKKFIYPNGRCILYETEFATRKYVSHYALYTEDGYKSIRCKVQSGINSLKYDVYTFDNKNNLIEIIAVEEVLGEDRYTSAVSLPPQTSYARFVLRKVDDKCFSNKILVDYDKSSYIKCAILVAIATVVESTLLYALIRDVIDLMADSRKFINIEILGVLEMIFVIFCVSLLVAWLTILAYRRNCKKVINR